VAPEATAVEESEATGIVNDTGAVAAAEIEYIETEAGTGVQPRPGDIVSVHYTGTLEDGTVFDSSVEGGQPYTFVLGQGQVIPGWDQGIALMREGGKATLIIPPELAYGEAGRDPIPANATLTFEVELVQVIAAPEPADIALEDYEVTESGLRYFDLEPGVEDELPAAGDSVTLHFYGWLEDGTSLGGTQDGPPATFQIGGNQVFPGLEEGVSTMSVGSQRQLLIPPELAFGDAGSSSIPPNTTIILQVTLLNIIPLPEPAVFPEIDESEYEETASGLQYYDIEIGEGASPQPGQQVQVHYTGWLTDGTKFDSSIDRGLPIPFPLGTGGVIPGWDEGIATMQIGGIRVLRIPPELAYGPEGNGAAIPPNATLIFEVHLLDAQ
jgi:peptidylprolyl isomerase